MKLLITGIIGLFIGSFTGYGGSYFVDSNLLGQKKEISESILPTDNKEVLSINTSPDEETAEEIFPDYQEMVDGITPSVKVTPSQTPRATMTPLLTFTPTPVISQVSSSQEINGYIEKYALEYGVDPHILRGIATCESGFNPLAVNKNYAGLYQFLPATWKSNRIEMNLDPNPDLRFSAEEAVRTAAYMLSVGKRRVWPVC